VALNLKRKTWRKIGYGIFIPLGLWLAADYFGRGDQLRALALIIQVVGAILALPFVRLVRWPYSDASLVYSGILAGAVFMAGKFLEWYLRHGFTWAVIDTLILLSAGALIIWSGRELGKASSVSA
jgi:hypothetical protein